jgi:hypothetical protein
MSGFQRSVMMAMGGGIDITTSSNAENVNLRTLLDAAGFDNNVPTIITYRLNSGVTVTSAASTGTATPAWQTGTIGSIHTVLIYISGAIKGYGGAGGVKGSGSIIQSDANGKNGGTGGTAMSFACNSTLVVNSGGSVLAGGGGGGGGGGAYDESDPDDPVDIHGGVGGMGAGTASAGSGGSGGTISSSSSVATSGDGGDGGAHGAAGSNGSAASQGDTQGTGGTGGASGYAVAKNSNTVTTTNNGTISGTQG